MKEYITAIITFLILWPVFFFSAILYHNSFVVLKKVFRLNFKEIGKVEFWLSLFIALLLAAIISYSFL
jgi:hypothetical protein